MKKITYLFAFLFTMPVLAQNHFTLGVVQDFSSTMALSGSTKYNDETFHLGATNARIGFTHISDGLASFEIFAYNSVVADKYNYTFIPGTNLSEAENLQESYSADFITRSYQSDNRTYSAKSFGLGIHFFKEVSQYFAIGSGFQYSLRYGQSVSTTSVLLYQWQETQYVQQNRADVTSENEKERHSSFSVPIVLRAYLPGKNASRICLSSVSNFSLRYITQQIGLTYEF